MSETIPLDASASLLSVATEYQFYMSYKGVDGYTSYEKKIGAFRFYFSLQVQKS